MLTNRSCYNEDCWKSTILINYFDVKNVILKIWFILERDSNYKSFRLLLDNFVLNISLFKNGWRARVYEF
jgi:hypothetical protein